MPISSSKAMYQPDGSPIHFDALRQVGPAQAAVRLKQLQYGQNSCCRVIHRNFKLGRDLTYLQLIIDHVP